MLTLYLTGPASEHSLALAVFKSSTRPQTQMTAHAFGLSFHTAGWKGENQATYCSDCATKGDVFHSSANFLWTWVASSLLPSPLTSTEIKMHWQALTNLSLRNVARKTVMFDHCKMGTFNLLPPHFARWDVRLKILTGIHKDIPYLANWLCC